jgi:hypothetical protein
MEREARGVEGLPDAPSVVVNGEMPDVPKVTPKERMEARRKAAERDAGPIAA